MNKIGSANYMYACWIFLRQSQLMYYWLCQIDNWCIIASAEKITDAINKYTKVVIITSSICLARIIYFIALFYKWYKSPTSSNQQTCHPCRTRVHFRACVCTCAHLCGLTVFMCELYMACPRTVVHTLVYYYKLVAYADLL